MKNPVGIGLWEHATIPRAALPLSGDREAIERLKEVADGKSLFARILKTGGKAYHSHHMNEAASTYLDYLQHEPISSSANIPAEVPMFSTVQTGRLQSAPESYWVSNLNSPVLFTQGVQCMLHEMPEIDMLIEIGPHSALKGPLRQICQAIDKSDIVYLPTLQRQEDDVSQMLRLAGNLWVHDAVD